MKFGALGIEKRRSDFVAGGAVLGKVQQERAAVERGLLSALADPRLKVKPKQILHILIQLKSMLSAGVPILSALRTLIEHAPSPIAGKLLEKLVGIVEEGNDLSLAMTCFPRSFPSFIVHLIAAGERSGALDISLDRSCELLDKQIKLGGKIKGALAYPGFLLLMTFVMTTGILVFLVPKFEKLLLGRPELLPWPTKLVLASSSFLRNSPAFAGTAAALLLVGLVFVLKNVKIRRAAFDLISHLPVVGDLIHKAYLTRSVNSLALTLEAGVPILTGLEHARQVAELPRLRSCWESASAVVRDGRPMHTALEEADLPPALLQMIIAGESTGSLESSLRTAAGFLERETDAAMELFTGLLGPATVVIAGALVGFIVVALMMPILQLAKFVA
ncbi:MAG: type II secretion system F family protein [Planctomycetota bacterium]